MAQRSTAMSRVVAGQETIARPNLLKRILTALDLRTTLTDLRGLSDQQLHDVGLTREQVDGPIDSKMWDAPDYFFRKD